MIRVFSLLCIMVLSVNISFGQEIEQKREIRKGTVISGTCLFLTTETICVATSIAEGSAGASYLAIPLVGPFITNAKETTRSSEGLIVAIGISTAEAIGITLFTLGLVGKKKINNQAMIYPTINKTEYGLKLIMNL
jgi:hypothetical protein